jgi:hypothetical protein
VGDRAIEAGVLRFVDPAHAAGAKGRDDVIGTETSAGGQPHQCVTGASRRSSSKKLKMSVTCVGPAVGSVLVAISMRSPS